MARYAGIRRRERVKLNRNIECEDETGSVDPDALILCSAQDAIECALHYLQEVFRTMDSRANEKRELGRAIRRLQRLGREIAR